MTVTQNDWLAARFEEHRRHLRSVAYRMLGSLSEADDAVQEGWLRVSRAGAEGVDNLGGWLTTVVARVCLDMLRSRAARREAPMESYVPDPVVTREGESDPEEEALLADSVGLALLVMLETLAPAERLALVLHDVFAVPFEEIGTLVDRSPEAARQLASRARRRVRGATPAPDADVTRQREVVNAFLAASRNGDFDALLNVLHPDVVFRLDRGAVPAGVSQVARGASAVTQLKFMFFDPGWSTQPALVNGAAGLIVRLHGRPLSIIAFTVADGRIAEIDVLADPARVRQLDLPEP
ncbi:MAG TPA: sigma-70 family RNA polymerase sigma factor [Chloroflexota bacterium]|nr:sigma-70 family RNA polymerase sigma factor [Chloroflexota bacterium]